MNQIKVYTDGACSGNPGPGGWGYIALVDGKEYRRNSGYHLSTNNRMEIMAFLHAVKDLYEYSFLEKDGELTICTDSSYLMLAFTSINKWARTNFKDSKGQERANVDLLAQLAFIANNFKVNFIKVKGHSGDHYNEIADKLATSAITVDKNILLTDDYYLKFIKN